MSHEAVSPVADRVIKKCGGHRAVADHLGVALSVVYRWTYPRARGGTGGSIPTRPREALIRAAQAGIFDLRADDLVDLPSAPPLGAAE